MDVKTLGLSENRTMGHSWSKGSLRSQCAMSKNPSVTSLLSGISSCGDVPLEDAPTSYSALMQKVPQPQASGLGQSAFPSGQQMLQPMVQAAPCISTMAVNVLDPSAILATKQQQQQQQLRQSLAPSYLQQSFQPQQSACRQQSTCSTQTAVGQTLAFATQQLQVPQLQQIVPRWYIQEVVEFEPCDPMAQAAAAAQKAALGGENSGFGEKTGRKREKPGWCSVLAPCFEDPFEECYPKTMLS